ncbi:MAG: hypothetical protein V4501_05735 [Pseudomonadota bacterium]
MILDNTVNDQKNVLGNLKQKLNIDELDKIPAAGLSGEVSISVYKGNRCGVGGSLDIKLNPNL